MTVNVEGSIAGPYFADGVNRQWDVHFRLDLAGDVQVHIDDGAGHITVIDDIDQFTWTPTGETDGYITYPLTPGAPLAAPQIVTIVRNMPLLQQTVIGNQGAYKPRVIELLFDRVVMMIQQIGAGVALALRAPLSDGALDMTLPGARARANKLLGFDAQGKPYVGGSSADPELIALAAGNAAQSAATASTGAVNASNAATLAQSWASQVAGFVAGTLFKSAYQYALAAKADADRAAASADAVDADAVATAIAGKADRAGDTFTGPIAAPSIQLVDGAASAYLVPDRVDASQWKVYATGGQLVFEYVSNGVAGAADGVKFQFGKDGLAQALDWKAT